MNENICNLSIIPLRAEPAHRSEMVSQILFGESFSILEEQDDWVKISLNDPIYEGWIQRGQFAGVSSETSSIMVGLEGTVIVSQGNSIRTLHGSFLSEAILNGNPAIVDNLRTPNPGDFEVEFDRFVHFYLNTPYLWGGRSSQGIDCSGLSHLFYRHFGRKIARDASQQALEGVTVDFLPEVRKGDLAFFDNEEGRITHVGIMMDSEHIFHASVKVRVDKMDANGIFNQDLKKYTHKLRIVKRFL